MRTIQEITQTPLLQLNKPKLLSHGMKIYNAPCEAGAFTFKINGITTPFAPSVFNGTGEETRQSVVFSIPDEVYQVLRSFEDDSKAQLSASECPKVEEMWHGSLKPAEKYAATFKAKVNLSGESVHLLHDGSRTGESTEQLERSGSERSAPNRRSIRSSARCWDVV